MRESPAAELSRRRARNAPRRQAVAERVAAATEEASTGFSETAVAAQQLSRAMAQIASSAERASGTAHEFRATTASMMAAVRGQREGAESMLSGAEKGRSQLLALGRGIDEVIGNIGVVARRQAEAVNSVADLERVTGEIGGIVTTVAEIADQTSLLALNAAVEAARAGKYGKGFAVVADEVRTLAQTAERSSADIETQIAGIRSEVDEVVSGIRQSADGLNTQVARGAEAGRQMEQLREEMGSILAIARDLAGAAQEAERSMTEIGRAAESIVGAAEQQASSCEEAARMAGEQSQAVVGADKAGRRLAEIADRLRDSDALSADVEEVTATAEELTSVVQEVGRASAQIETSVSQIARGAEMQSGAVQQCAAAVAQIERNAERAVERSREAANRGEHLVQRLRGNRGELEALIGGVTRTLDEIRTTRTQMHALELFARRIDKTVDAVTIGGIQTNMLAVSGTIEAARAAEFGRGFAVVSGDIRNLARDSAENTDRIKDMVRNMQDQINLVRHNLEEIAVVAAAEAEKTGSIRAALLEMERDAGHVVETSATIAASAHEIRRSLGEIRHGIEQIAASAVSSSEATREAATAASQQLRGAEELSASVEEIASLANEMQGSNG